MALGFLALILVGALLLMLPVSSATGRSHGFFKSLFTATSAVCVTGLVVVDTGTAWSTFGQVVLMLLIQMGGLGFMVFATLIMVVLGRRITLKNRMLIRESMNTNTLSGLVKLTMIYGLIALCIELTGALLLSTRFIPRFGLGRGIFYSLFHAVSAFCNAGFDLIGGYASLVPFQRDPVVLLVISLLIILGGLGFSVLFECFHFKRFDKLSLHARLVLIVTGLLLASGTLAFCLLEWNNPETLGSGGLNAGDKLINAWFQSVTLRTAGFNSVDLGALKESSKLFSIILMFIGAAPASTGGGVKVTTMGVLFLIVLSVARGREQVTLFNRRLPVDLLRRAIAILFISLAVLLAGTLFLTLCEHESKLFLDLWFEATSAFATVGVSSVGTPQLTQLSQVFLISMMFFGRVGPLTLALALANRQSKAQDIINYPEEKIMIG